MTIALSIVILVLIVLVWGQARENRIVHRRLRNVENELAGRLDIVDDQISELGGGFMAMLSASGMFNQQGIRTFNHDYDGKPLSSYIAAIVPERFRRSGEMYVGNPNNVKIPPANTTRDFHYGPVVDLNQPIVPQPFADGEPYQNFDEAPADEKTT